LLSAVKVIVGLSHIAKGNQRGQRSSQFDVLKHSRFALAANLVIVLRRRRCLITSPPQDGFAVANLGQPRKLSGLSAIHFGTDSVHPNFLGRCPRLKAYTAPLMLKHVCRDLCDAFWQLCPKTFTVRFGRKFGKLSASAKSGDSTKTG
jgi:hypothetical protein